VHFEPNEEVLGFVCSNLDVCGCDSLTKFGLQNVAAICLQKMILAFEPMVDFMHNLLVESLLMSVMGVARDGRLQLGPDFKEDSPFIQC
jgi:hypothetical protein